jgi:hypothetical protein
MKEEVIQMVDDDEIENVGIMSGFMDELDELISEIDAEDLEKNKGGDEADTAQLMGRTPNSPEILMNNLRGDMRSVDARREELADLVGMREAQETPEGVLTLLQSVLAQQEAVPPMPMAPPMPPQGMPPEMMGGMPPEMMGGMPPMPPQGMPPEMMGGMPPMPPQGMAPPPMGIESVMPDMPGMYRGGPVQNFNQGSGAMGVTPASDAFAAYPSDVVEEAKRRVRHMVDGGMVQKYNRGGVVQHFQDGSEEAVSPAGRYSPEVVSGANAYIQQLLEQQPGAANIDLETAMGEEAALYEALGLGTDPKDAQAQMLFDIGQAAFGYAGNVGADGRPMQGSAAARLSQALGPLSGKIGAQAGQMSKEAQALKMMALKGAQGKIASAQASDTALAARQGDLAIEIAKQKPPPRMLTEEEIARVPGLDPDLPWQLGANGEISIAGGREPRGDTFNLGDGGGLTPGQKKMDEAFAPINLEWLSGGGPDMGSQIASLATVARQLEDGEVNLTGLDIGLMPDVVNYFINPLAIDARDNVEAVVQRNLRLILGAQFTEKEGVRLIARAYNTNLTEAENAGRVRRLLLQMTTAASQKQAMSDWFMEHGTLNGWTGAMPSIADFENAIDGAPGFTVEDIIGNSSSGRDILEDY